MQKKLVVVTGGTKGIGRAIIEGFAVLKNYDLVTCSRNDSELNLLKNQITTKHEIEVHTMLCDLSNKPECLKFVDFVNELDRDIAVLVNNAGVFLPGSMHDEPEGNFELMMQTNLNSAYNLTRGFVERMKSAKSGYIFNICSTASIMAYPNGGSYCISKFALYGLTKVIREELKDHGVRVTAIIPGATLTASWDGVDLPPERFMKPEDVASAVINAFEMSENSVVEEILIRPQLGDI